MPQGLQAIRCPAGLFFDIEKQTCDWKDAVKNCKLKNKERKVKPLLYTDEPICQEGFLACGDALCMERGLFCNGEKDCADGSDENSCGEWIITRAHAQLGGFASCVPAALCLRSNAFPFTIRWSLSITISLARSDDRRVVVT